MIEYCTWYAWLWISNYGCPYLNYGYVSRYNWFMNVHILLLLISMLWHRQVIFESKGDKLSSSAECRIRTCMEVSRHLFASRPNAQSETDWAIEDQAKNLNSTARPYDKWAKKKLSIQPTWPGSGDIHVLLLWHRQAIFESKGDKLSSSADVHSQAYIHNQSLFGFPFIDISDRLLLSWIIHNYGYS